jgi:hypothetical protein
MMVPLLFDDAKLQPLFIMAVMDFSGKVLHFAVLLRFASNDYFLNELGEAQR